MTMNTRTIKLELIETPVALDARSAGIHRLTDSQGLSLVNSSEVPLWYDSTADIAAWETMSLCVNQ
jgi:hypothetical protein